MADNDDFGDTLGQQLVTVADSLRRIRDGFGLRPYRVRQVRVRWTGGERGLGERVAVCERVIEPTPRVDGIGSLERVLQSVGSDEEGAVTVSEISGRYTEDDLLGHTLERPVDEDTEVFWEVELRRSAGCATVRRRFVLDASPEYDASKFEWRIRLKKASPDRDVDGGFPEMSN